MKFISTLSLLSVALAYDIIRPGTVYISKVGNLPSYKDLAVEGTKLKIGGSYLNFIYDTRGTLELQTGGKFLGVGSDGKFFVDGKPHTGFSLETLPGADYKRKLHFNKENEFELCGDNSIGFNSKCAGARPITITYEDIIQPR